MAFDRRIYSWGLNDDPTPRFARGFIFVNNHSRSKASFDKLVTEAKRCFPSLTDDQIELGKVSDSTYMKGFAMVEFPLPVGTTHSEFKDYGTRNRDFSC